MKLSGLGCLVACLATSGCVSDAPKEVEERSATDLYVMKGIKYLESGRLDVARQDLEHAVELDDNNAEAHNALGVLYERMNLPEKADEHYRRALALDDGNMAAANNYARSLCSHGKYDQAMKLFASAIASNAYQTPWLALTSAGICAKSQGLGADAETYLRKALEANPNFAPALLEMAKISLEHNNYLSSRAFLQRFESAAGANPESLWIGVQTEQALGNRKDAEAYRKRLQQQYPDSKEAVRSRTSHAAH